MNRYEGKSLKEIDQIIGLHRGQGKDHIRIDLIEEAEAWRLEVLRGVAVDEPKEYSAKAEKKPSNPEYWLALKYTHKYENALKRGIDFSLTLADFKRLLKSKKCYYTHVDLVDSVGHPHHRTLDRIDSKQGYTKENTVSCSDKANQIKNYLFEKKGSPISSTVEEMNNFMQTITMASEG